MKGITHELLEQHMKAKAELNAAKEKEMNLRLEITDVLLEGKSAGTYNFKIDGMKVKAVQKINHSIDEDELELIWDEMEESEKNLVRFKPSLKLKDYKAMVGDLMINNAITVSPATPSLVIDYDG